MASVVGKQIAGHTYYYLVDSERVDGKPRITGQRYLGSADTIAAAVAGTGTAAPTRATHRSFGDVAAVWATLRRLRVAELTDDILGPGRAATSPGSWLALAVLHRATAPQLPLADWWSATAAARFVRPRPGTVTDAQFWHGTRRLAGRAPEAVAGAVAAAALPFLDHPVTLAVDLPHVATYEDADATVTVAGMTAAVTRDGAVPLAATPYRGDRHHPPLARAAASLATLVFDTGQHAQVDLDGAAHYVGALPLADHPALLARTVAAPVHPVRYPGLTALDTRAPVLGRERRVVLTHSARLHAAQARGLAQALAEATRALDGLAAALATGRNRLPRQQVHTEIARITRGRWVDGVLAAELTGREPAELRLHFGVDEAARARLDEEYFGKRLLVTDHDDWPVVDVVTAHRARYHLDATLRMLHGAAVAPQSPRWTWTGDRIAVHTLVSMLATTVTHLMRQHADRAGIDLSVRELLDALAGIGETELSHASTGGRPRTTRLLTRRTDTQQRLYDLFGLAAYASPENAIPRRRSARTDTR